MWKKRSSAPVLVALLSLGFMSQSPVPEANVRRIAGTECVNCGEQPLPGVKSPIPAHLALYLAGTGALNASESFANYLRQLQFQTTHMGVNPILLAGSPAFYRPFGPLPSFPNYALPTVSTPVTFVKPDSSRQIFGGLTGDPSLQYLVKPIGPQPGVSVGLALGAQDAAVTVEGQGSAPQIGTSTFNTPVLRPERLSNGADVRVSGLTGSRVIPKTARPEVEFTVNGDKAPAGFIRPAGSPPLKPVASAEPNDSPNPIKEAIIKHSFAR
jgi:hypothetical protein